VQPRYIEDRRIARAEARRRAAPYLHLGVCGVASWPSIPGTP
jgi:hypothetical protein